MIGNAVRTLGFSNTMRRVRNVALGLFAVIILLATNPSLDEFKAYAMLNSTNPGNVVAARTSYWLLFSIYQAKHFDKETNAWNGEETYIGVLNNFINVSSR